MQESFENFSKNINEIRYIFEIKIFKEVVFNNAKTSSNNLVKLIDIIKN